MLTNGIWEEDESGEKIQKILVVNLSSLEGKRNPDTTLVLEPEEVDDDEIKETSFVIYQYATVISVDILDKEKKKGKLHTGNSVDDELFKRIVNGLKKSIKTPGDAENFYDKYKNES